MSQKFLTLAPEDPVLESIEAIKSSLLDGDDWANLLSSAPRVLCSIGKCFVIAWSKGTDTFVQKKDKEISPYLRANLIETSDRGYRAFLEAEKNADKIVTNIKFITGGGGCIASLQVALKKDTPKIERLQGEFGKLQKEADACVEAVGAAITKFEEWKGFVEKMSLAYAGEIPKKKKLGEEQEEEPSSCFPVVLARLLRYTGLLSSPNSKKKAPASETQASSTSGTQDDDMIKELRHMTPGVKPTKNDLAAILYECHNSQAALLNSLVQLRELFEVLKRLVSAVSSTTEEGLSKESLRHDVVVLSEHYKIALEICLTYVEISKKYIMPGVREVESLSRSSVPAEQVADVCEKIAKYTEDSLKDIKQIVQKRTKDLNDQFIDDARSFEVIA